MDTESRRTDIRTPFRTIFAAGVGPHTRKGWQPLVSTIPNAPLTNSVTGSRATRGGPLDTFSGRLHQLLILTSQLQASSDLSLELPSLGFHLFSPNPTYIPSPSHPPTIHYPNNITCPV